MDKIRRSLQKKKQAKLVIDGKKSVLLLNFVWMFEGNSTGLWPALEAHVGDCLSPNITTTKE